MRLASPTVVAHRVPLAAVVCLSLALGIGLAVRCHGEDAEPPAAAGSRDDSKSASRSAVPPVPEGSVEELLDYIADLDDPARAPASRGRRRYHRRKVLAATVEAADRILEQLPEADARRAEVLRLKFAALEELVEADAPGATEALSAFAATLADGPGSALAVRARAVAVRAEIDALVGSGRLADAPALIQRVADLLDAAPDDTTLAQAAARFATTLAQCPGGDAPARLACETFLPRLEKSGDRRIAGLAGKLAGTLRLVSLPGNPLPITGRLLDGAEFDPESIAGKVVLVDFWATWCGPCVAEIANIRAQYDRLHDHGFEVVGISLDDDVRALERFVAHREIPWPIVVDAAADRGGQRMAERYGITGIPRCILLRRDGTVVATDARGPRLKQLLDAEFPDVAAAGSSR